MAKAPEKLRGPLNTLYRQYGDRDVNDAGIQYWGDRLISGQNDAMDVINMLRQNEDPTQMPYYVAPQQQQQQSQSYRSPESYRGQLDALYQEHVGRNVDEAGLKYWGDELARGKSTMDTVTYGLRQSDEYQQQQHIKQQRQLQQIPIPLPIPGMPPDTWPTVSQPPPRAAFNNSPGTQYLRDNFYFDNRPGLAPLPAYSGVGEQIEREKAELEAKQKAEEEEEEEEQKAKAEKAKSNRNPRRGSGGQTEGQGGGPGGY